MRHALIAALLLLASAGAAAAATITLSIVTSDGKINASSTLTTPDANAEAIMQAYQATLDAAPAGTCATPGACTDAEVTKSMAQQFAAAAAQFASQYFAQQAAAAAAAAATKVAAPQ